MKTLFELKQNLATVGAQLKKTEDLLASAAIDTTKTTADLQALQKSRDDLKMRFDVIKDQHDKLEAEEKATLQAKQNQGPAGIHSTDKSEQFVSAFAEMVRASIQKRPVSDDVKNVLGVGQSKDNAKMILPKALVKSILTPRAALQVNPGTTGGQNFLPTTLSNQLISEPFVTNPLRDIISTTNIKGLEVPKILFELDDDDFITDEDVAKEIALTGDKVAFGRFKSKIKVKISDSVIYGSDLDLTSSVQNGLQSGLAGKERKNSLTASPKTGEEHMSFYASTAGITAVTGDDLYDAITKAIADLHEDFRANARILMRYTDYLSIIKTLANGNATLFTAQPEQILGKPVTFCDLATTPIVGDFNYYRQNYDGPIIYDTDKDVDKGEFIFVITAWLDQQFLLKSAFRTAKVTP